MFDEGNHGTLHFENEASGELKESNEEIIVE